MRTSEEDTENLVRIDRVDGYGNIVTGMGSEDADSSRGRFVYKHRRLSSSELDAMYEDDSISSRIVDRIVDDAIRVDWKPTKEDVVYDWDAIRSEAEDLEVLDMLGDAWRWSRLHAGGVAVLGIDDGVTDYSQAVNFGNIRGLRGIVPLAAPSIQPYDYDMAMGAVGRARPYTYKLTEASDIAKAGTVIHHSRIIRFDGIKVPPHRLFQNDGWGASVLQRCWKDVHRLDLALGHAEAILEKLSILAVKLKGMRGDLTKPNGETKVRTILRNIQRGVSNLRMLALDSEDELMEIKRSLEGLAIMIDKFVDAVVRSSNQPRLVILGEQPGGLNADARGEVKSWYNVVGAARKKIITPALNYVLRILMQAKYRTDQKPYPDKWVMTYESLEDPDEKTEMEIDLTQAQRDQILILNQIASPEELRKEWLERGRFEDMTPDSIEIGGPQIITLLEDPNAAQPSADVPPEDLVPIRQAAQVVGIPTRTLKLYTERGILRFWEWGSGSTKHRQVSLSEVWALGIPPTTQPVNEPESETGV